jgi:hypothetical protein
MKTAIALMILCASTLSLAEEHGARMSSDQLNSYRCSARDGSTRMIIRSGRTIKAANIEMATSIAHYMFESNPNHTNVVVTCEQI